MLLPCIRHVFAGVRAGQAGRAGWKAQRHNGLAVIDSVSQCTPSPPHARMAAWKQRLEKRGGVALPCAAGLPGDTHMKGCAQESGVGAQLRLFQAGEKVVHLRASSGKDSVTCRTY